MRSGSTLLRPYNQNLGVDSFESQSVVDYGDIDITPGDAVRSLAQIDAGLRPLLEAGITTISIGGDHTIVLGELRAHAAVHGPLALVLLDAHVDTGDEYYGQRYFHGTPFKRAVEEGLLDPARSVMAGMRGSTYDSGEWDVARSLGFEVIPCEQLRDMSADDYASVVRARIGDRAAFLSFDIDVIDPGLAPGTGTPEVAGLLPYEALRFVRSLAGLDFRGYDVVEVSPQLDGPGQPTALLAANVAYEFSRHDRVAGPSRAMIRHDRRSSRLVTEPHGLACDALSPPVVDSWARRGRLDRGPGTPGRSRASRGALTGGRQRCTAGCRSRG